MNMDYMDIDEVMEVPDTPDKLAAQNTNDKGFTEKESNSSVAGHSGNRDFTEEGVRHRLRSRSKPAIDCSRRPSLRLPKSHSITDKSECHSNSTVSALENSSSSKNAALFRRVDTDKTVNYEGRRSIHSQHTEKEKALNTSQLPACNEDSAVVNLTEQNGHAHVFRNAFPSGLLGSSQAEEFRNGSTLVNGFSSLHSIGNSSTSNNARKGKERVDDASKVGSSFDHGKGVDFFGDSQRKAGKTVSASPIITPRVTGQKRLVRNGCISPHNIAKATQLAEKNENGSVDFVQNDTGTVTSNAPPSPVDVRDLIAEDNEFLRVKGKGIINHPLSSKEADANSTHLSNRSSTTHNEKPIGTSDASGEAFRCFEGLGGWRSTRNRTKKNNLLLSEEDWHRSRRKDDSCFVNQHHENRMVRGNRGNGNSARACNEYPKDQDTVSHQHRASPPVAQTVSHLRSQLSQFNEHHLAGSALIKRQKQGSTSSNQGECSTSAIDDSEIVFLGSSGEPSNSRSTANQTEHGLGILDPVIEIDEFSPEIRHSGSRSIGFRGNNDSVARARQVEADERLARELQEQLYNEVPGVGLGEIDAHIALGLQQEGDSLHAFSSGGHHAFHPRGSLISNLNRQPPSQFSQNPSIRRGAQARVPTSTRMARLRSRFPRQSSTTSSRERNSLFPPNVDVDMRIHILEALEAFSDMGMAGNFLQVQRDFNENDYEMLLALDENNHQHGVSLGLINGLPQSMVQSDNLEEACAICLEIPTTGDTIRHLPCLHKFHKDCIDPWLRRSTTCPVCKSCIM